MDTVEDIVKRLNALRKKFPKSPRVVGFAVEDGTDWMGEPALYIWVLLDSATPESELDWEKLRPIDWAIHEDIFGRKDQRYPYVMYRTEAEHAELTNGSPGRA